jgi:hypothetical protein
MPKLTSSRPFCGVVGLDFIMPYCSISLLVTFKTTKNYCTDIVVFAVMEFQLPIQHHPWLVDAV